MSKKSKDDAPDHREHARAVILGDIDVLSQTVPLVEIIAALAEALTGTTWALMHMDRANCGDARVSVAAARELMRLLAEVVEQQAVRIAAGAPDTRVH